METENSLLNAIPDARLISKTPLKGEKALESFRAVKEIYSLICILFVLSIM
jgi:hypothetical protein